MRNPNEIVTHKPNGRVNLFSFLQLIELITAENVVSCTCDDKLRVVSLKHIISTNHIR